jgi:hypothetical protein
MAGIIYYEVWIAEAQDWFVHPMPQNLLYPKKSKVPGTRQINIPVHTLSHLSMSAYDFLAECQQTAHAVVPVHTSGEFKLFKTMLNSGGFYKKSRRRQLIAASAS